MPLMEYRCNYCFTPFEKIVKTTDEVVTCPECGKIDTVVKVLNAPSFHLKGSGWAKDLYAGGKA
jgi:putative FmdB family regulatory protein